MPDVPAVRPATSAAVRLPSIGLMLAGQAGYQLRLLTRTPRALWFAIFAPAGVLALRLGHTSHIGSHPAAGSPVFALVAGLAVFGLLNTAYMTPPPAWSPPARTACCGAGGSPRCRPAATLPAGSPPPRCSPTQEPRS